MNQNTPPDKSDDEKKNEEEDIYKRLNAYKPPDNVLKKHQCKDCFNCLWCSDARCEVCLRNKSCVNCDKSGK